MPGSEVLLEGVAVIDADTHYAEPEDLWVSRAPKKYAELVPQVRESPSGARYWYLGDEPLFKAGSACFVDKHKRKVPFWGTDITAGGDVTRRVVSLDQDDVHPAAYDVGARVALMDELGIWAQIVYPNILGFGMGSLALMEDRDLSYTIVRIYNDAIAEWQAESQGRLFPQAAIPFWDIERSVSECVRIRGELGLSGIVMSGEPHLGGLPDLGDDSWNPLYEVVSDLDLPINIHVGATRYKSKDPHESAAWPSLAPRFQMPVLGVATELANSRFLSNLLAGDVLIRWPNTRWVSVESGIGWMPFVIERVDHSLFEAFDGLRPLDRPRAKELFQQSVYGCFWFEESAPVALIEEHLGVGNILWETDFPHPTCLYPDPVGRSLETFGRLGSATVARIMGQNAAELYGISSPAAATSR